MVIPASLAMILPLFPKERHATAVGTWAATGPLAAAMSPVLSAWILEVADWRLLYFVSAPIALAGLLAGIPVLEESKAERVPGRLDLFGVVIGTAAIASFVYGVGQLGQGLLSILIGGIGAFVLLPLLIWQSKRHPEPLVNLDLFTIRNVWVANLANAFLTLAGLSSWLIYPLFLQNIWEWEKGQVGLALALGPIGAGTSTLISGRLADRYGLSRMIRIASFLPVLAMTWSFVFLTEDVNYWFRFAPAMVLFAAGWGFTAPPLNSGALKGVPQDYLAEVNALFNTTRNVAGAIGIAAAIAIVSAGPDTGPDAMVAYDNTWLFFIASTLACAITILFLYPKDD